MELTAQTGRLPADTHLTVLYQGNVDGGEDYDLAHPPARNLDVCCRPGTPTTGKLPAVECGRGMTGEGPPARDAARLVDATVALEAGPRLDASVDGARPSSEEGDARRDAAPPEEAGVRLEGGAFDAGGAIAVFCELWTFGPAELVVTGKGYPRLDRELSAEQNACGLVTRDVRVVWTVEDGGR